MSFRALFVPALASIALLGCASHVRPPSNAPTEDGDWITLPTRGARMKFPNGFTRSTKGEVVVGRSSDGSAAIVFAGATTKEELEVEVRALGEDFKIDEVDFKKAGRKESMHGIPVSIFEDMAVTTAGTMADVLVLLGNAPNGRGVVMVFVMALDASQTHDLAIIDAANSLEPL